MSNENSKSGKKSRKRPYKLKARARRKEDVHRRITLAAVHLHETVGPAKTTMSAIAEQAGVQRATVYNHFPTELELIDACSTHWFTENPPPDPTAWLQIADPVHRTQRALMEMYDYYDGGQDMLARVLRDSAVVPAMDEIRRQKWLPLLEGVVDIVARAWGASADQAAASRKADAVDVQQYPDSRKHGPKKGLRASLRVALDFFTWQTLAEAGMTPGEAAQLATTWVEAGAKSPD